MELFARLAIPASAFVVAGSLLMLLATKDGTPERTITIVALIGGLTVAAFAVILFRLGRQDKSPQEDQ